MTDIKQNKVIFEPHFINDIKLPFIFHTDTKAPGQEFVNWHENIELLFVLEGEGRIVTSFEKCPLLPGDLCIINSNVMHYAASYEYVKYHCLIIDRFFSISNGIDPNKLLFPTLVKDPVVAEKYLALVAVLEKKGEYFYAKARNATLDLLLYLCIEYSSQNPASDLKRKPHKFDVRFSIGYINAHFKEKITLDKLAQESGVSKYHFTREFKRYTRDTMTTYINKVRCEHAKYLLAEDAVTVEKITYMCGFESPSYFTKVFKKIVSVTPSDYRAGKKAEHRQFNFP